MKDIALSILCAIVIAQGRELPTKQGEKTCNCNPSEAEAICGERDSDDILIAHEYCNKFYKCANGAPVAIQCPSSLLYNPVKEVCDWPQNVDCGDRPIYEIGPVSPDDNDDNNSDNGDSENGPCNCNPAEAPSICAREGSDGTFVAHENCNQYYICNHGLPITMPCGANLLYNPFTQICDWASNVDCGDRLVPEDNGGNDNGDWESNETSPETCNCNPEEAPSICASPGSDSVLIAHENCDQYYQCNHGVSVALKCPSTLLYNPYIERCDWPNNVDCGERIVPCDCEDGNSEDCDESNETNSNEAGGNGNDSGDNSEADNNGNDSSSEVVGGDNGGGESEGATGSGNCDPSEAPTICATEGSDGVLVAHEKCNKYYICDHGVPVARPCPGSLLFNPQTDQCDWPENVDCGDRVIPDPEDNDIDNGGGDNEGSDNGGGDNGGSDNEGGDNGGNDNGGSDNGSGTCNCNPGEAPGICSADDSDGILVAHENCNQFYKCAHGVPVAMTCYGNLYYNPYTEQCDWPENVDCGDRLIPEVEGDSGSGDSSAGDNGNGDTDAGDNGSDENGGNDNDVEDSKENDDNASSESDGATGGGNCDPSEAPIICAAEGSDGVLIAHEKCNKYYICDHGIPVARPCPGSLLFNPQTDQCDWPENVDCGDRVIPDPEDNDIDNGGDDNGGGDNGAGDNGGGDNGGNDNEEGDNGGSDNEGGDNGGGDNDGGDNGGSDNGSSTCNCNPGEAPGICSADDSDGILVAHENCNQFYKCAHGVPVAMTCYGNLYYNPYTEQCDWPENVDCGDRLIPEVEGDSGSGDSSAGDNGNGDTDAGDNDSDGNGGNDNDVEDSKENDDNASSESDSATGGGNCDPSEAPTICATEGSDGVLIAHEKCNKYYICDHGIPVVRPCPGSLLFNPQTDQCDWPENVDCGDRVIPDPEDNDIDNGGGDNGGGDNGGSDNGGGDNGGSDNGGSDNEGGDNEGGDNGGGDNGGSDNGSGTCNCNPGEAPGICSADDSDGILVAHEQCNKFYKCANGVPVALQCYGNLLYNPYTEQCDWPENVDCGDRVIPDFEDNDNDNGGGDSDAGDNGAGDNGTGDNGAGDNGGSDNGSGTCNCSPGEAPGICSADDSDGILVAHEQCNKFYKCANGVPVALQCYGNLLYNPYTEQCDWPENVDCGDRVIPDFEDNDNDNGGGDSDAGDNGAGDNGTGDNGAGDNGDSDNGSGTCNCNPGEAPGICSADDSDGILVAHEQCNKFYKCANGVPVALQCYGNLLYNPYTEQCDWPENVDCGDRVIPDSEGNDNDNGGGDSGAGDNGAGDNGGGDNGGGDNGGSDNGNGTCNCNPGEAPGICSADNSDGILVAHEQCNKFYKCANGVPVALQCYGNLLYNPYTEQCDWPENVDCGDRVIPDFEDNDNDNGGGDSDAGDNGTGDNGAGDNGGSDNGSGTCNCNPGEAPGICSADDSDGILVAHEQCNKFYKCANGVPVALQCYGNLLYNPYTEQCDWPENVDCEDRVIPDSEGNDNDNGGGDSDAGDNGVGDNGTGDNGAGDNGGSDNGSGTCNCNPGEAPGICSADGSDGILVAHEQCNKFYKCANGVPVALQCYGNLLYNPYTEQCDWPENVDCEDRVIPDSEGNDNDNGGGDSGAGDNGAGDNGAGDNGGSDNGSGTCNCNPGEAPGICSADDSDGILVAHEQCNKFYKCANGVPVALQCYGNLLYNPYTEQCDWPENVDCGDRVIPDFEDNDNGGGDSDAGDNGAGDNGTGDNGVGDNGGSDNGSGTCNCNPGEAPGICSADDSDGILVAHEQCNKFYKCANGVPVALQCYGNLLYNPYTEQCDWPENVDCGDRVIPDSEGNDNDNGGGDSSAGDNGAGDNGGGDNGGSDNGNGTCNCNPGEAPGICSADDSDGILVAHEQCNKFYKCANGVPVALQCYGNLLYNPYTEQCDWPENVDCGDRVIPDSEGNDNDNGGGDSGAGDNGAGDNGGGDNGGSDNGNGTCNCNPGEAPGICSADNSDGILVAHEQCNKFYKCSNGVPVALQCYGNLLYNPYTEQCDWPENVDCGDRIIPDSGNENDSIGSDIEGDNNSGSDTGSQADDEDCDESDEDGGSTCNCDPNEAQGICAAVGSQGVLIAHENCNQFYQCSNGQPVAISCSSPLLYNPYTQVCDWPQNVECGDRVIPDPEDNNGSEGNGNGDGDNDSSNEGGHSDPSQAPAICAAPGSDNVIIAHENCNQFYICANGIPVASTCVNGLLYNPINQWCDWADNVDCGDRLIPELEEDNGNGGETGGSDNGGTDNGGSGGNGGYYDPSLAPEICAADDSNNIIVAHEDCNKFYICNHGKPVTLKCPNNLLYNPTIGDCDWPSNVECGDRIIPDESDSGNSPCNCNPRQAIPICSREGSDGKLIAHENCNQYYMCVSGSIVARSCPANLFYNPEKEACDWPLTVNCDGRLISTSHIPLNKHLEARNGFNV